MCLEKIETVKNRRKFAYKCLDRAHKGLSTPYACMPMKDDTTIWQDASKVTESGYRKLRERGNLSKNQFSGSCVAFNDEHKGLISVFLDKEDAIKDALIQSDMEVWKVEIKDKIIKVGFVDYRRCALVKKIRLVSIIKHQKIYR